METTPTKSYSARSRVDTRRVGSGSISRSSFRGNCTVIVILRSNATKNLSDRRTTTSEYLSLLSSSANP